METMSYSGSTLCSGASVSRRGFTLIEILVAVGIIVILMTLVITGIPALKRSATNSAVTAQLGGLQTALAQYYSDFGIYPDSSSYRSYSSPMQAPYPTSNASVASYAYATPSNAVGAVNQYRGAAMLAEGLMGYMPGSLDGAGPDIGDPVYGFRSHANGKGKVYGPYASEDTKGLKINSDVTGGIRDRAFIDVYGNEIFYFRSRRSGADDSVRPGVTQIFGTDDGTQGNDIAYFTDTDNKNDSTGTALNYPTGAQCPDRFLIPNNTALPLPSAALTTFPPSHVAPSPSANFFTKLGGRTTNLLSSGSGTVTGANSYILISAGADGIYYSDDDIVVGGH